MRESHGALRPSTGRRFFAARLTGAALQRRKHHVPVCEAHGRNMIAEAACSRSSLSEMAGCAGLCRQDTFPLRLRRGRGNVQGNLAAQGFRTRRTCRQVRIPFEGLWPSKPPKGVLRRSAAADGTGKSCRRFSRPCAAARPRGRRCPRPRPQSPCLPWWWPSRSRAAGRCPAPARYGPSSRPCRAAVSGAARGW